MKPIHPCLRSILHLILSALISSSNFHNPWTQNLFFFLLSEEDAVGP